MQFPIRRHPGEDAGGFYFFIVFRHIDIADGSQFLTRHHLVARAGNAQFARNGEGGGRMITGHHRHAYTSLAGGFDRFFYFGPEGIDKTDQCLEREFAEITFIEFSRDFIVAQSSGCKRQHPIPFFRQFNRLTVHPLMIDRLCSFRCCYIGAEPEYGLGGTLNDHNRLVFVDLIQRSRVPFLRFERDLCQLLVFSANPRRVEVEFVTQ